MKASLSIASSLERCYIRASDHFESLYFVLGMRSNTPMSNSRIYLSPPHLSGNEQSYVADAIASNWIAPLGPHVDAFEKEFSAAVDVPHALALSSGTAALHLALRLIGVGPTDDVVV